jgi:hypothetical protein
MIFVPGTKGKVSGNEGINLIDLQSDKSGCNGYTFNKFIVDEQN